MKLAYLTGQRPPDLLKIRKTDIADNVIQPLKQKQISTKAAWTHNCQHDRALCERPERRESTPTK